MYELRYLLNTFFSALIRNECGMHLLQWIIAYTIYIHKYIRKHLQAGKHIVARILVHEILWSFTHLYVTRNDYP